MEYVYEPCVMEATVVGGGWSRCSIVGSLGASLGLEVVAWGVDAVGGGLAVVLAAAALVVARDGLPDLGRAGVKEPTLLAAVAAARVESGAWALRFESMLIHESFLSRLLSCVSGLAEFCPVATLRVLHPGGICHGFFIRAWAWEGAFASLAF